MPELTHDTADDGFHEIQLSGKQLIFLFMTATLLSVVIFLLGVHVGRTVRAERGDVIGASDTAAPAAAPATADAGPAADEAPAPPPDDELSYHRRLQGNAPPEELKPQPQAAAPPPAAAATPAVPASQGADVPTAGRAGTWFVQVLALQNRSEAAAVVNRLLAKGYPAYLENPAPGAPPIYRVRIGRFTDRREAEQVARRLEKEEQFRPDVRR